MARSEASTAKWYIKDECIGFVTKYLQRFDVVERQVWDADEEYGDTEEVPEGGGKPYVMITTLRDAAHKYTLTNMVVMQPWLMYTTFAHPSIMH